jgi:ubiquinone/menaquinone biosynthesis C-methylase UbiE
MNADPLAPWYRFIEYAAFGQVLEHHRFLYLDRLTNARKILVMGEGDGRSLARLLEIAPHAQMEVVESSARMIALAQRRVGANPRVAFRQQDATTMTWPPATYDAVITSFFLDCFDEATARTLVRRLAQSLTPGGLWLMNDFAIPPGGWQHWRARIWIGIMYRFFRVTTGLQANKLPPINTILIDAGLRLRESRSSPARMIVSQIWKRA